jgi:hypothetical protein
MLKYSEERYADGEGTRLNYEAVNDAVSEFRASKKITDSWREKIDEDYTCRSRRKR